MRRAASKPSFPSSLLRWGFRRRKSLRLLEYSWARGRVQPGDSEGVGFPFATGVPGASHHGQHFIRLGKRTDGGRQIAVRTILAADDAPDCRQHAAKVKGVDLPEEAAGLAEFKNAELTAGLQYAMKFAQAGLVIREVAEAKRCDNQVERFGAEREAKGIGLKSDCAGPIRRGVSEFLR